MKNSAINRRVFLGSSASTAASALMLGGCGQGAGGESSQDRSGATAGSVGVDDVRPAFSEAEDRDRVRRARERLAQDNQVVAQYDVLTLVARH